MAIKGYASEETIYSLTRMNAEWQFINGPSKFDLMISLFEGSSAAGTQKAVSFQVRNHLSADVVNLEARIQTVAREDGSGESWIIEGWVVGLSGLKVHSLFMKGYFSTANRHGSVNFRYSG